MAYIGQSNRQRVGPCIVLGILVALFLFSNRLYAQNDNAAPQLPSADTSSREAGVDPQQPTTEPQQATEPQEATDVSQDNDASQQPAGKNLETGLPLHSVLSPVRWGRLSLLSFTAFSAYDNNYQLQGVQQSSLGSQLTVVQGLVIYSIQGNRWSLDFQYHPSVWFSQHTTHTDFAGHAVDFHTARNFGRQWRLNVSDNYQYSPALANSLGSAFNVDFSSDTASSNPFLSTGHKFWINSANVNLDRVISERSKLSFTFTDSFIRLSGGPADQPGTASIGTEEQHGYGPGVTWSRQWNSRNTVNVMYNYRRQTSPGSTGSTDFQTVGVGYNRLLRRGLTATVEIGPGWSSTSAPGTTRASHQTTLQGSAELFKQFAKGGVALTFYRNNEFSGVISNSYSNRYNLAVTRRFHRRLNAELSASYVQQEFVSRRTTTGELGFAQLGYLLSRSWSVFTSYRYFNTGSARVNGTVLGPQHVVSAGIRWAWDPERK